MYDFFVCTFIFLSIFYFVWTLIGYGWHEDEPTLSPCRTRNDGIVMTAALINLIAMQVFQGIGLLVFILHVILYACDDGSCNESEFFKCCVLMMTCGCVDIGKEEEKKR